MKQWYENGKPVMVISKKDYDRYQKQEGWIEYILDGIEAFIRGFKGEK